MGMFDWVKYKDEQGCRNCGAELKEQRKFMEGLRL